MYPERPDIAVPPFPPGTEWIGSEPAAVERLCARGPLLVHFVCAGDLGSVRTLPYLRGWEQRYGSHGLTVLAVNTPRFAYTARREALTRALVRLGVGFPVALDSGHAVWHEYGCMGWPSLFLWAPTGALHWYHFGEGAYEATEREIQALIRSRSGEIELPAPLSPLRPSDAPEARVMPPTPEIFPGGSISTPWAPGGGERMSIEYEAGGAALSVDGEGEVAVSVDGEREMRVPITTPGVYELTHHGRHERHTLTLAPSAGVSVWAVSFAAGVP